MPPILNSVTQFVADTIPSPYGLFKVVTGLLAASSALVPGDDFKKVPVATHGWEIKLGINENALKGGRPTHELMHAFSLEDTPDTRAYSYYDNDGHELNKAGWAIRLRHKDGKDFEMTYKKRYTVKDSVEEALKLARDEGFDKSDKNYDAEVDWTYSKKVCHQLSALSVAERGEGGSNPTHTRPSRSRSRRNTPPTATTARRCPMTTLAVTGCSR